jgi:hypothetical protein
MRGLEGVSLDQARHRLGVFTPTGQNSRRHDRRPTHSRLSCFEHPLGAFQLGLSSARHPQFDQEVPHVRKTG